MTSEGENRCNPKIDNCTARLFQRDSDKGTKIGYVSLVVLFIY